MPGFVAVYVPSAALPNTACEAINAQITAQVKMCFFIFPFLSENHVSTSPTSRVLLHRFINWYVTLHKDICFTGEDLYRTDKAEYAWIPHQALMKKDIVLPSFS